MNDKEKLERKESNRYRVLKLVYDAIGNQPGLPFNREKVIRPLIENESISQEEINDPAASSGVL